MASAWETGRSEGEREEESPPLTQIDNYKHIISTLPRRNCWATTLYQFQGFWYPPDFILGMNVSLQKFTPHPSDIFLCSFPKTGTTWLKALAFAIVTRSHLTDESNSHPLLSTTPHDCVPFIEEDENLRNPEIPLLATHRSYAHLPPSVAALGCKLVYICRDPKDVFVSTWYFMKKFKRVNPESYHSLEEALELFCEGVVPAGPYWEHLLGYWKASIEFPERVLFIKYEDQKKDTAFTVKKLAEFMGYPFSTEEEKQGLVEKIINLFSFENLRNLDVTKNGEQWPTSPFTVPNASFFRRGEVGDWKNHLTEEMANRLDQITEEKLGGSDFRFLSHQSGC